MSRKSVMLAFAGVVLVVIAWLLVDFRPGSRTGPSAPMVKPSTQRNYGHSGDSSKNVISPRHTAAENVASDARKAFRKPATLKLPEGALKDNIESLEDQTEMGNAEIAYALSEELHFCAMLDS